MHCDPKELIANFIKIAQLSGITLSEDDIIIEVLSAPHDPPSVLPSGKMAVYVFFWKKQCLKVGKVGPKSQARYTSHHYNPKSSNSNLAKSILKNKQELGLNHLTEDTIGDWLKTETDRINFIVDTIVGICILSLLEVSLQCRLKPIFEGFDTQK